LRGVISLSGPGHWSIQLEMDVVEKAILSLTMVWGLRLPYHRPFSANSMVDRLDGLCNMLKDPFVNSSLLRILRFV
jgi:hypothetical protein